jgi:hypothetical protein
MSLRITFRQVRLLEAYKLCFPSYRLPELQDDASEW